MVTDAELYQHMLQVAKAAGFVSITEAIAVALLNKADAERYRWLRDGEEDVFCMFGSNGTWGECGHIEIYGDRLDEHIDAARSQSEEKP